MSKDLHVRLLAKIDRSVVLVAGCKYVYRLLVSSASFTIFSLKFSPMSLQLLRKSVNKQVVLKYFLYLVAVLRR
jgi:hypothetical protein